MTEENDKKPSSTKSGGKIADMVAVASYPVGIFAGYKVTAISVRDEATKNLTPGLLEDLQKTRSDANQQLRVGVEGANPGTTSELAEKLRTVEKNFYDGRAKRFEKMGIKSTADFWGHLRGSEKWGAIIQGATVSSIIIGGAVLITQSKNIFANLLGDNKDKSR